VWTRARIIDNAIYHYTDPGSMTELYCKYGGCNHLKSKHMYDTAA